MSALTRGIRRKLVRTIVRLRSIPEEPEGSPVVVVAPHPDDEAFGCGGMIALRKQLGHQVTVIFLSDGEASHVNCCQTPPPEVAEHRWRTAVDAGKILGLSPGEFCRLGLPDRYIPSPGDPRFEPAVERLTAVLASIRPRVIYVPHEMDSLADHEAAYRLTLRAWSESNAVGNVYYYPVWLWHNASLGSLSTLGQKQAVVVNIASVAEQKRFAIQRYLSDANPQCRYPYCGNLTPSFLSHFRSSHEIFFVGP